MARFADIAHRHNYRLFEKPEYRSMADQANPTQTATYEYAREMDRLYTEQLAQIRQARFNVGGYVQLDTDVVKKRDQERTRIWGSGTPTTQVQPQAAAPTRTVPQNPNTRMTQTTNPTTQLTPTQGTRQPNNESMLPSPITPSPTTGIEQTDTPTTQIQQPDSTNNSEQTGTCALPDNTIPRLAAYLGDALPDNAMTRIAAHLGDGFVAEQFLNQQVQRPEWQKNIKQAMGEVSKEDGR